MCESTLRIKYRRLKKEFQLMDHSPHQISAIGAPIAKKIKQWFFPNEPWSTVVWKCGVKMREILQLIKPLHPNVNDWELIRIAEGYDIDDIMILYHIPKAAKDGHLCN